MRNPPARGCRGPRRASRVLGEPGEVLGPAGTPGCVVGDQREADDVPVVAVHRQVQPAQIVDIVGAGELDPDVSHWHAPYLTYSRMRPPGHSGRQFVTRDRDGPSAGGRSGGGQALIGRLTAMLHGAGRPPSAYERAPAHWRISPRARAARENAPARRSPPARGGCHSAARCLLEVTQVTARSRLRTAPRRRRRPPRSRAEDTRPPRRARGGGRAACG